MLQLSSPQTSQVDIHDIFFPLWNRSQDSQGDRHVLAASDLWSCGIVIYVRVQLSLGGNEGVEGETLSEIFPSLGVSYENEA